MDMNKKTFSISDLIDVSEKIYKKHGNLAVYVGVAPEKIAKIKHVGVATKKKEDMTGGNIFMCLSPFPPLDTSPQ